MSSFPEQCRRLLDQARDAGWSIAAERAIPYGRLYTLSSGGPASATLSCYYGKKGFKYVLGGKAADALAAGLGIPGPAGGGGGKAAAGGPDPFSLGAPRVGADESGKGDYFGPLVVAAWRLDEDGLDALAELGVTDSKALSDKAAARIAGKLEALGHGAVLSLMPREYNPRYAEVGNLNVLLADMHAACIRQLVGSDGGALRAVLVDQFSTRTAALERALALPASCRFVTRTKGEADPAVAAASVLARAAFLDGLRDLSHEFGQVFPPGAGAPVLAAGRDFVAAFGRDRLPDVAKVHFATTRQL
jgi:ribonuclease HIII